MTLLPSSLSAVRRRLEETFGMDFPENSQQRFVAALEARAEASGFGKVQEYATWFLSEKNADAELKALGAALTIRESFFFRYPEQLELCVKDVLPELHRQSPARKLRILSAGCASGEEPYSVAIFLLERKLQELPLEIIAIDLDPANIQRAKAGRYSHWALRSTPVELRERYFERVAQDFQLRPELRKLVRFQERNLLFEDSAFWAPEAFDVIFCRNVLIYFSERARRQVLERFVGSMRPGGYLFLGTAESRPEISRELSGGQQDGAFYFRKIVPAQSVRPASRMSTDRWYREIQRSSEAIKGFAAPSSGARPDAGLELSKPIRARTRVKEEAFELLRNERFQEGVRLLNGISEIDEEMELLLGIFLLNSGKPLLAEELCRHLLSTDDLDAATHYLLALCREARGSAEDVEPELRRSIYLDPSFAMPHVHLAFLAKRKAGYRMACREFKQARTLLLTEDDSRLLLFGGGFGREALVALCETEMRTCAAEAA